MLKVFNSLSREKEIFKPLIEGQVKMYVCGMTVYDFCHLGHARVLVVFDIIVRHLRALGYSVLYVRNITDIDDKIIVRANENGESIKVLTDRFIDAMHEDSAALGVVRPDIEPRATDSMDEIQTMIQSLIDKGFAYQGGNGDVYYSVSGFESYGQLSHKKLSDLRSGARVDVDQSKQDPLDFVLWKMAKEDEPSWESPWGNGRPGWHIECSAMATNRLGAHFDIHGGGMDLQFPHHENEIAQSEACTGEKFVNYWIHNGFVQVDEEKMSKSLGNFFTVREILKTYKPEEVRYFILASQYRSPLNYSDDNLKKARSALQRLYTALRDSTAEMNSTENEFTEQFQSAMNDDFNTPEALAVMFNLAKAANRARDESSTEYEKLAGCLKYLGVCLGILQADPEEYLKSYSVSAMTESSDEDIDVLIQNRLDAKSNKDFAEADRIRDLLTDQGIILEDSATGTRWRRS